MIGLGQQANDALLPCQPVWKSQDQTKGANECKWNKNKDYTGKLGLDIIHYKDQVMSYFGMSYVHMQQLCR